MKNFAPFTPVLALLSPLVVTASTPAQPVKLVLPTSPPDTVHQVERQSGTCPSIIGVWNATRQYEGGGEFTIIPNTWVIAGRANLSSYTKKSVEYTAPLKLAYASCVGQARGGDYPYRFRFSKGNVSFRVELPPDTPATPSEFTARSILGGRPYVRWAIAD